MRKHFLILSVIMIVFSFVLTGCDLTKGNSGGSQTVLSTEATESATADTSLNKDVQNSTENYSTEMGQEAGKSGTDDATEFKPMEVDEDFDVSEEIEEGQGGAGN